MGVGTTTTTRSRSPARVAERYRSPEGRDLSERFGQLRGRDGGRRGGRSPGWGGVGFLNRPHPPLRSFCPAAPDPSPDRPKGRRPFSPRPEAGGPSPGGNRGGPSPPVAVGGGGIHRCRPTERVPPARRRRDPDAPRSPAAHAKGARRQRETRTLGALPSLRAKGVSPLLPEGWYGKGYQN